MSDINPALPPGEEQAMARLLRLAGPRSAVPAERAARVREAVQRHWRVETRRRQAHRRIVAATAMLASAAALVLVVRLATREGDVAPAARATLATVVRVDGEAQRWSDGGNAASALRAGDAVRTGDAIGTGGTARAALRLAGGTSLRLDAGSRARVISDAVVELTSGALYLDTGHQSAGLEVRTPLGTAHDVGTQFEVRLQGASLRVRVRSGLVELRRDGRSYPTRAGTELTVTPGGTATRAVPVYGPEWAWTASAAPAFDSEGRTLAVVLDHIGREHGWTVSYADAALARDASSIVLHGSVGGLAPEDAVAVALRTSGLVHRLREGEVLVSRPADPK